MSKFIFRELSAGQSENMEFAYLTLLMSNMLMSRLFSLGQYQNMALMSTTFEVFRYFRPTIDSRFSHCWNHWAVD